jgi:hypothetical protein
VSSGCWDGRPAATGAAPRDQPPSPPTKYEYTHAQSPGNDNSFAAYNAVQCTDTAWPTQWATWSRANWTTFTRA